MISRCNLDDIPVIRRIANVAFRHTYRNILSGEQMEYMMNWMYSEESLTHQIRDDGHQFFLADADGEPVGYASVSTDAEHVYHLQKLYVLPLYQGKGIGKQLLTAAVDYLRSQDPEPFSLELNVNRNNRAVGFYRSQGLEILRQGDFPIGGGFYMNDYIMGLQVPALMDDE